MRRQLYRSGGITNARQGYGIGSWVKEKIRKIIPNELADIATKAAPFVAPFNPIAAGLMRGVGRFDQRGSMSDALKQGLLTYGGGQLARHLGGAGVQESWSPMGGMGGGMFRSPIGTETGLKIGAWGGAGNPATFKSGPYQNVHQTGAVTQTPGRPTTTTTRDDKDDDARSKYLATMYDDPVQEKIEYINPRTDKLVTDYRTKRYSPTYYKDKYGPKEEKSGNLLSTLLFAASIISVVAPILGFKVPGVVKVEASLYNTEKKLKNALKVYNKLTDSNLTVDKLYKSVMDDATDQKKKQDLINSLPKGHPERIALEESLDYGPYKKPEHLGDGDQGDVIDITYENIEETNKQKEMIAASKRQYDMLYTKPKEDRSKQMAYWQSLMAPYMSAKGGRVPGGYNTGGLSNLFRLKNR